ncbi:MAG: hypothetical protein ACRD7E_31225 [Bryobacteraceae bacterium]
MTSVDKAEQDRRASLTGLVAVLTATTMLFAAFCSAYIVRRGITDDWTVLRLPGTLYLSVLPGVALSIAAEASRRYARRGQAARAKPLLWSAAALGAIFAAIHLYAWRELHRGGASLSASPAAAFFFVFDGVFVTYVLAGLAALLSAARQPTAGAALVSYYWLYLNALWIFLLAFLYLWS